MKRVAVSFLVAVGIAGCANTFFPLAPDQLFETQLRANCNFAFNCCEAVERAAIGLSATVDEATCVEQGLESGGGGSALLGQRAQAAVNAGKAVYDGDLAERCLRPFLDSLKACDVDATATSDIECRQGSARAFVTGTVKQGDDCTDSLECADEGDCVVENDDRFTVAGICEARAGEGDACSERSCVSSLSCDFSLETPVCVKVELRDNGESCFDDAQCSSKSCLEVNVGTCFDSEDPCEDDDDCATNDFCDVVAADVCGDAPAKDKVEFCNGRE